MTAIARGRHPLVSVVMTVHDGEPWTTEAVESVLKQSFADFELIVVDDGSTDATPAILRRFVDARLRVITQPPTGQTSALNRALRLAAAPLLARMDADDVALPDRLERQVAFLEEHAEVGLLGTACHEISATGEVLRTLTPPLEDGALRRTLIRTNPFIHTSVVFRRAVLEKSRPYDERFVVAQDYELWLRMSRSTQLANLAEPLVLRRMAPGQLSSARDTTRLREDVRVKLLALAGGSYPFWNAIFLAKPLVGLALPLRARRSVREWLARRRGRHVSR